MDYSILKKQILDDIKKNPIASSNSKALNYMISNDKATYQTAGEYSKILGDVVSQSINKNIPDGIPDDELGAFAQECLVPVYKQSQDTMLNVCQNIQASYNKKANIGLNPVEVSRDDSRTQHIADRFNEATSFNDVNFLTNENVARSITRGAVNDSIESNARVQSNAGLKIRIARSDGSGCCKWCSGLVGEYDSFDKLPQDFWKVHRGCGCVIDYNVGKTSARVHFEDGKKNLTKITESIDETPTITPNIAPVSSANNTKLVDDLTQTMKINKIAYNPVSMYSTQPTEDEIIQRLGGGDTTKGSCASLSLAYMGNKDGMDVLDFRGGKSQSTFSRYSTLDKIFALDGVVKYEEKDYNGIKVATDLMKKQMVEGKEYCLIAGQHASMVRMVDGKYQYLELQSATQNGWTSFSDKTLHNRFGATKSSTHYGMKLEQRAILVDADSLKGNQDFKNLLGYINTNESKQQKGASGFVK